MRSFRDYVDFRENDEEKIRDMTGLGDITSGGFAPDETLIHIAQMAIKDHYQDVIRLFQELAAKDQRIRLTLEDYMKDKQNPHGFKKAQGHRMPPAHGDDGRDEVVPSSADSAHGADNGQS